MHNLIILFGVILIGVGTLLTYWGTDLKNKKTTDNLQNSINSKNGQIDELVEGKNTVIEQNIQLNRRMGKYQQDLKEKEDKINELEKFAKKDIYKPLSNTIRPQLIQDLKIAKQKIKKVLISSFDSNNNGKKVIDDLVKLFEESGIEASIERTGISFGRGVSHHRMKVNQSSIESADHLCGILSRYIKIAKYNGVVDNKLEDGVIDMEINGIPLFHEDGTVEFQ
jgi:hypothetical protein